MEVRIMGKVAYSVSFSRLGPLKRYAPCRCYEDPYKYCDFFVDTKTLSSYTYGKGPEVTSVVIRCNSCGKQTNASTDGCGIYEKDLNF